MNNWSGTTPKAIRTGELILDTVVDELSSTGLDHVTFTTIARRAGLTTGALYSRFENSAELLVTLWEERLKKALLDFVETYESAVNSQDQLVPAEIVCQMISDPSKELKLAIEAVAIGARIDELQEVVSPVIDSLISGSHKEKAIRFHIFTVLFGRIMYLPFSVNPENLVHSVRAAIEVARDTKMKDFGPLDDIVVETIPSDVAGEDDELMRSLMVAARSVIARSGFEHSTVSRIARVSGRNSATIYQYFDNKAELLARTVSYALKNSLVANMEGADQENMIANMAQTVRNHLTDQRRQYLRFRLEAHVAALHNAEVAKVLHSEYNAYIKRLVKSVEGPSAVVPAYGEHANATYLGRSLLFPYVSDVREFDWRPAIESDLRAFLDSVLSVAH